MFFSQAQSDTIKEHRPTWPHPNADVRLSLPFSAAPRDVSREHRADNQIQMPLGGVFRCAVWFRVRLACFNIAIYIEIIFNIFIDISQ